MEKNSLISDMLSRKIIRWRLIGAFAKLQLCAFVGSTRILTKSVPMYVKKFTSVQMVNLELFYDNRSVN